MLIGLTTLFFVVVAVIWWVIAPSWVPLFSYPLPDASQKEVLDLLSREGVSYKVDSKKNTILIQSSNVHAAHQALAEHDLPKVINNGLEMFNNSDYGLSEFAQNINYQRGMEEELARTIMRMEGVRNARVHLTIKKDSLFEDRKQEPKASVVISFKDSAYYDAGKIRGIQEVLSAAIPNLLTKNVVVITDKGDIVSSTSANEYVAENHSIEDKYRSLLINLLDDVLGEASYKLSVNVQMDYKKKITIEESFFPEPKSGKGFIVKKRSVTKSNDHSIGAMPMSGQNTMEEEFVYSKERSEIAYPVGEIRKISVGLVVSSEEDYLIESLRNLVQTTIGMDEARGDKLSIITVVKKQLNEASSASIGTIELKDPAESEPLDKALTPAYLQSATLYFIGFCVLALLFFAIYMSSQRKRALSDADRQKMVNELVQWMK